MAPPRSTNVVLGDISMRGRLSLKDQPRAADVGGDEVDATTMAEPVAWEGELASVAGRWGRARLLRAARLRAMQLAILVAFVVAWKFVVDQGVVTSLLARGPAQVWEEMRTSWASGALYEALKATMEATLLAFFLASAAGIVIGTALAFLPRTEQVLNPFLDALNSMPRIALGPVFIIAFGISTAAKVALAFTIVVFILIYNTRAGFRTADPDLLRLSRVMGASRWEQFSKIMFPLAVPSIFAGLRLGLIYSLLGVVTAEIIASRVGLGQLIIIYSGSFRLEGVYGILIILAVVSSVLNMTMIAVERYCLRWQAPEER
jgi:NitT/TauT family transport system permease protein